MGMRSVGMGIRQPMSWLTHPAKPRIIPHAPPAGRRPRNSYLEGAQIMKSRTILAIMQIALALSIITLAVVMSTHAGEATMASCVMFCK